MGVIIGILGAVGAVVVVIVVLLVAGVFGGGGGGSAESQIRSVLEGTADAANDRDYDKYYGYFKADARDNCPRDDFEQALDNALEGIDGKFSVKNVDIEIDGDEATARYDILLDGEDYASNTRQDFVKEDGKWYLADDSAC